ncbi:hypothetical protein JVT61DRAFT_14218 [Boletus reticuloceps]|uniref:C2H2-type domain-containing protein n=1 Tax=Boletus reticuloceps TaxID=495285 RepID=A0A8I2YCX4_9AGAM|nr:hypothetical protein JVT61DRAFT_14218 [Boletus reticuloceps]
MPQAKTTRRQLKTISCPRCGRKFRTEMNVLQHMNQPTGLCNGSAPLFNNSHDPIHGVNVDLAASPSHATVQLQQEAFEPGLSEGPNVSHEDEDIDMNDIASDSPNNPPVPSQPGVEQLRLGRFVETFKGCGETFSGGKRFMDDFWANQYVEQRHETIPGHQSRSGLLPLGCYALVSAWRPSTVSCRLTS